MNKDTKEASCIESRPGCIKSALAILGDQWSPLLLRDLTSGPKTFGELEESLEGISPRTLSQRIEKLLGLGIIIKSAYCEKPPRYTYSLSPKGSELETILRSMAEWGSRHHTMA